MEWSGNEPEVPSRSRREFHSSSLKKTYSMDINLGDITMCENADLGIFFRIFYSPYIQQATFSMSVNFYILNT